MASRDKINIGMIGSGFAAALHAQGYARVAGVRPVLLGCASIDPGASAFAAKYGFAYTCDDYRRLLDDPAIDVIDIIVPPALHTRCVLDALAAGKHVICEKPLTGYFGREGDTAPIGHTVPRAQMQAAVEAELQTLQQAVAQAQGTFMYAENWVYMPAVQKAVEIIRARGMRALYMRGEESHSGSHAPHAAHFSQNGGGSLIRQGAHPLSTVLYLKQVEAQARGEAIAVASVLCETAVLSALAQEGPRHIASKPVDVEDWAQCTLTFTDGTKAEVLSADVLLGGVKNRLEIYGDTGVINCNVSPNDAMQAYFPDEAGLEGVYLTEKAQNKAGWQPIFLDEMVTRGYVGELEDFMACAAHGRQPLAGFGLAAETTRVIYAAYRSAEEGKRIALR